MGHEDKQLIHTGYVLLDEIIFTATAAIEAALKLNESGPALPAQEDSPIDILIKLPLMQYMAKAITDMLYHPAW